MTSNSPSEKVAVYVNRVEACIVLSALETTELAPSIPNYNCTAEEVYAMEEILRRMFERIADGTEIKDRQ